MVIIITGASHTGKTVLAQKMLEAYHFPYLSLDHLKMGLIRSGNTTLTPMDDDKLTDYLWNILREIIKTAIENGQNLIVEGCYIPFDWKDSFADEYLAEIRYLCLIMSDAYLSGHFGDVIKYENAAEHRMPDPDFCMEYAKRENAYYLDHCRLYGLPYLLIDGTYNPEQMCSF